LYQNYFCESDNNLGMSDIDFVRSGLKATRNWRDLILSRCNEIGLRDLSYRPRTGMSAFGWILAHQAAVFDFSLNVLVKKQAPINTEMFESYRPGTDGSWIGTGLDEIKAYYDSGESSIIEWVDSAGTPDFEAVIEEGTAPKFFVGMTIRDVIANMFCHLSFHSGQLESLRRDWLKQKSG
jgi:hypothetical protein